MEVEEAPSESFRDVSFGRKTPHDLTEIALRTVLFGELNPIADKHMGFMTEIDDPLQPLRESPVSEEIIRPLSELLVTDLLVAPGVQASFATSGSVLRFGDAGAWRSPGRHRSAMPTSE